MRRADAAGTLRPGRIGPTRLAQAGARASDAAPDMRLPSSERSRAGLLPASNVHIVDATVRYLDERSGTSQEVSGLDLDLAADDAGNGIVAKGGLNWTGEKIGFEAKVASLRRAGPGQGLPARRGPTVRGHLRWQRRARQQPRGRRRPQPPGRIVGRVGAVAGQAARQAAAEMGALAVSARIAAADRRIALNDLSATLGDRSLTGAITVATGGPRPHVSGQLQLSELDFGRLLVRPRSSEPAGGDDCRPDRRPAARQGQRARQAPQVRDCDQAVGQGLERRHHRPGAARPRRRGPRPVGRSARLQERHDRPQPPELGAPGSRGEGDAGGRATLLGPRPRRADTRRPGTDGRHDDQPDPGRRVGAAAAERRLGVSPGSTDAARSPSRSPGRATPSGRSSRRCAARWTCPSPTGAIIGLDIGRLLGNLEKARFSELRTNPKDKTPFSEFGGSFVRRQRRRPEPGPEADQPASARERLGLRQPRPAPGRLHRAPEDRGELRPAKAASSALPGWRCRYASREPGKSRPSRRI